MIYLATPYTHPDPSVMEERFDKACRIAGELMASGEVVYSPIAHTHPIAVRCDLPREWEYWQKFDREMLTRCSSVLVVMMEGWWGSKGVAAEVEIAKELGIPVHYCDGV